VVIDASVAASWFLETQATSKTDALLLNKEDHEFVAPILFAIEIRNVLLLGERRGSLTAKAVENNLLRVSVLIDIESGDVEAEAQRAMDTARASGLKLYDAIYLTKAMRENRPLATRDAQLLAAAVAAGVEVYDARR
jgi:predicted nucleic acid-binding protein